MDKNAVTSAAAIIGEHFSSTVHQNLLGHCLENNSHQNILCIKIVLLFDKNSEDETEVFWSESTCAGDAGVEV